MENHNKMSEVEVDELRKSLVTLNFKEDEIKEYIEKAMKSKEEKVEKTDEGGGEPTIADQAADGEKKEEGAEKKEEPKKEMVAEEDDDIKKCATLKAQKEEIEKAIAEFETKMGVKKEETIEKSTEIDIEKAFGERFVEIEKALTDKFEKELDGLNDIIKGLQDEVKRIGDMPLGTKAVITKANFFQKGNEDELNAEDAHTLSISRDKDEILKSMEDVLSKETDPDARQLLEDGILDYTVNTRPTTHGLKALGYLSRKKNITLEQ